MPLLTGILGVILLLVILWDGFEVIILPRRVTRKVRLSRQYYQASWFVWSRLAKLVHSRKRRERYLSFYGPLSLLLLIVVWAVGMILAFALVQWSVAPPSTAFASSLYLSGSTFITLGLGDVLPRTPVARLVTVLEAGTGFGFIALVISYLPVLYQAFARRETNIALLDARAGSPPAAAELFRRFAVGGGLPALDPLLHDWEVWSADLLESYISYPVLAYFRSQHDNQSWLAALTTILDVCAVIITGVDDLSPWQARLTFAMARHTVVDLAQIINAAPQAQPTTRLSNAELTRFKEVLVNSGMRVKDPVGFDTKLAELRRMYEPYVVSLARKLMVDLSAWTHAAHVIDNWRTSAWEHSSSILPQSLFDKDLSDGL